MHEYPKMLVREGTAFEWEGRVLDHLTVADADEEAAARDQGWHGASEQPEKAAPKKRKA
jgi:hypothetical protein